MNLVQAFDDRYAANMAELESIKADLKYLDFKQACASWLWVIATTANIVAIVLVFFDYVPARAAFPIFEGAFTAMIGCMFWNNLIASEHRRIMLRLKKVELNDSLAMFGKDVLTILEKSHDGTPRTAENG